MLEYYHIFKALHIISFISWMAGMLYLPRLFVYHSRQKAGGEASEMLKLMEKRLLRFIINPAMISTWFFGILLIIATGYGTSNADSWIHIKIFLVIILSAIHGMLSRYRRDFEKDANRHSEKFYRILNEAPTLLMIFIVFLAVLKPF